MSRINTFFTESSHFLLQGYLLLMGICYPLYTKGSYTSIGEDKYFFYKYVTMSVLVLVLFCGIVSFLTSPKPRVSRRTLPSLREWFVVFFIGAVLLSFFLSPFREAAWTGADGWFMGAETLLLIALSCLFLSRLWRYSDFIWGCFLMGSVVVYGLGISNRFSFYPISFEVTAPDFISTLGNINWYCSYFSVMWPIGACFYLFTEKRYMRILAGGVTVIGFGAGVTQGSSSVFLSLTAVFYLLLFVCVGHWRKYGRRWIELGIYWCFACQMMGLLRILLPGRYNYEGDNLCGKATGTWFSIYLMVFLLLLYLVTVLWEKRFRAVIKEGGRKAVFYGKVILAVIPLGGVLLYFLVTAVNTWAPMGIPGLTDQSLFVFNQSWGNARGATWTTGLELFTRMDGRQKLVGMGPDCFVEYLYTHPDLMEKVQDIFDGAVLKNAHNEWITMLVNLGVLGTAAYGGIFAALFLGFGKKGEDKPVCYIPVVCAFSYLLHNMVSFGQVLNMPFLFLMIGAGESYFRATGQTGGHQWMEKESGPTGRKEIYEKNSIL